MLPPEPKPPQDILPSIEAFKEQLESYDNDSYGNVNKAAYDAYALEHHKANRERLDAIRAAKIEKLTKYAAENPKDAYYDVDNLVTKNPIELDRLYAYYIGEEFWDVLDLVPWNFNKDSPQRPGGVHLFASDAWGGGRFNLEWHIDTDVTGCFEIDIPGHFCGGIQDLENMILALIEARNILGKKWDPQWCNWDGKGINWEINETEVLTEPAEGDTKEV